MATEPTREVSTREVLSRELPELPLSAEGQPTDPNDVAIWCYAAVELINDLRAQMVQLAETNETSADAFNRMVRLGNQAAEHIVSGAHEEASRILASAQGRADATEVGPVPLIAPSTSSSSFREQWERDASIDERVADRAFFEDGFDEPSRSWILADAG